MTTILLPQSLMPENRRGSVLLTAPPFPIVRVLALIQHRSFEGARFFWITPFGRLRLV
jgi:hypothetical protein